MDLIFTITVDLSNALISFCSKKYIFLVIVDIYLSNLWSSKVPDYPNLVCKVKLWIIDVKFLVKCEKDYS